jgi:hypothetical protein
MKGASNNRMQRTVRCVIHRCCAPLASLNGVDYFSGVRYFRRTTCAPIVYHDADDVEGKRSAMVLCL